MVEFLKLKTYKDIDTTKEIFIEQKYSMAVINGYRFVIKDKTVKNTVCKTIEIFSIVHNEFLCSLAYSQISYENIVIPFIEKLVELSHQALIFKDYKQA